MKRTFFMIAAMSAPLAMGAGCKQDAKPKNVAPAAPAAPTKAASANTKVTPAPTKAAPAKTDGTKAAAPSATPTPAPAAAAPAGPPKRDTAKNVVLSAQALAKTGDIMGIAKLSTPMSARGLRRYRPEQLQMLLKGEVTGVDVNGGREVVKLKDGTKTRHIVTYNRPGGYQLDLAKSARWQGPDLGATDPLNKAVTVEEATKGISGTGKLYVKIATSMGDFNCELFEKQTPKTVANFVGLARGLRGFLDPKTRTWTKRKLYDGLVFHRVIPKFMIQGGDVTGTGSGGIGFTFEDEFDLKLRHSKGGLLSMANRGPNTNSSQFFVTEKATPWLDDGHTIFGECAEKDLVKKITGVPATASRPNTPVTIKAMTFERRP